MDAKRVPAAGIATGLLLGVVAGGTVLAQSEGPGFAEATGETLFELTVPSEALPDVIYSLMFEEATVVAGADTPEGDASASQANESMQAMSFLVERGELLVEPTSDTLVWREAGAAPEVATDGEAVTLSPGEAIFLPAIPDAGADPEKYLRIANPGSEDALVRMFHAHTGVEPFGGFLQVVRRTGVHTRAGYPGGFAPFEDVDVLFRLTRWSGEPGAVITLANHPALAIYLIESGTLEETTTDSDGETTDTWEAGIGHVVPIVEGRQRSLAVAGDEAAAVVELVAIPQPAE